MCMRRADVDQFRIHGQCYLSGNSRQSLTMKGGLSQRIFAGTIKISTEVLLCSFKKFIRVLKHF